MCIRLFYPTKTPRNRMMYTCTFCMLQMAALSMPTLLQRDRGEAIIDRRACSPTNRTVTSGLFTISIDSQKTNNRI